MRYDGICSPTRSNEWCILHPGSTFMALLSEWRMTEASSHKTTVQRLDQSEEGGVVKYVTVHFCPIWNLLCSFLQWFLCSGEFYYSVFLMFSMIIGSGRITISSWINGSWGSLVDLVLYYPIDTHSSLILFLHICNFFSLFPCTCIMSSIAVHQHCLGLSSLFMLKAAG